jgi:hypothetical protein
LYLPAGAVIEVSAAKSPDGVPTAQDLTPLAEKGKYTIIFPIRPGETQIEVAYHLPYTGKMALNLKVAGLTEMLAVSMPKSMSFTPGADAKFAPVTGETSSQTYVARGVSAGDGVAFEIGGTGQLPRDTQGTDQSAQGQDAGQAQDTAPGKGLGNPLDPNGTNEPFSTKYKWWMLGTLGLLLVAAAGVLLRKPTVAPVGAGSIAAGSLPVAAALSPVATHAWSVTSSVARGAGLTTPVGQAPLLQVLKDELFGLETERLQGRIGEAEYAQNKAAIELILRRALARDGAAGGVPPAGSAV